MTLQELIEEIERQKAIAEDAWDARRKCEREIELIVEAKLRSGGHDAHRYRVVVGEFVVSKNGLHDMIDVDKSIPMDLDTARLAAPF